MRITQKPMECIICGQQFKLARNYGYISLNGSLGNSAFGHTECVRLAVVKARAEHGLSEEVPLLGKDGNKRGVGA